MPRWGLKSTPKCNAVCAYVYNDKQFFQMCSKLQQTVTTVTLILNRTGSQHFDFWSSEAECSLSVFVLIKTKVPIYVSFFIVFGGVYTSLPVKKKVKLSYQTTDDHDKHVTFRNFIFSEESVFFFFLVSNLKR